MARPSYGDDVTEAELLFSQALAICEQKLGVNHPHTVTVRKNLADLRDFFPSEQ